MLGGRFAGTQEGVWPTLQQLIVSYHTRVAARQKTPQM